jgi:uncharacterized membrane protein
MAETQLSTSRMEAFSDGVIAVIITIMVLELHVPSEHLSNIEGLRAVAPTLFIYLLSFIQVGIYWVNHHYLVDDVEGVTHGMLWANLSFLFCLSLFPFAARWVGERGISSFSIALYSVASALPGIAWIVLSSIIIRRSKTKLATGMDLQIPSAAMYLGSIPMAYVSPYISIGMIILVAIRWLIPPKKIIAITRVPKASENHPLAPHHDPPSTHSDSR